MEPGKAEDYQKWLKSHKPFHWFVEFYGIMKGGGFDVIIGNPPYVEITDIRGEYTLHNLRLIETGNLFSVCLERFSQLIIPMGLCGVIVPISSVSTPRMLPLMRLVSQSYSPLYLSHFAVRPSKLFVGTDMNLTIMVGKKARKTSTSIWSTGYNRWQEGGRQFLFSNLLYIPSFLKEQQSILPKIGTPIEQSLLSKIISFPSISRYRSVNKIGDIVYYHSGGRYFRKCIRDQLSNEYKPLALKKGLGDIAICLLSSSLYYWYWIIISDCYHVTKRDIDALPFPDSLISDPSLHGLADVFISDLHKKATVRFRNRRDGFILKEVNFQLKESKSIVDKIDQVLAKHYGLTEEELDFVINYDIKYRMGQDLNKEEE